MSEDNYEMADEMADEEKPDGKLIEIKTEADFENAKKLQEQDPTKPIVTYVSAWNNFTTDATLAKMVDAFPFLRRLDLRGCKKITDAGMQHVARLFPLQELDLRRTDVSDAGLQHLVNLSYLEPGRVYTDSTEVTKAGRDAFEKNLSSRKGSFRCSILIIEARNLPSGLLSKPDAYVKIIVEDKETTSKAVSGAEPKWNEQLDVNSANLESQLVVQVWNKRLLGDSLIGEWNLGPLPIIASQLNQELTGDIYLQGMVTGQIKLKCLSLVNVYGQIAQLKKEAEEKMSRTASKLCAEEKAERVDEQFGKRIRIKSESDFENAKNLQEQDPTKPILTNVSAANDFTTDEAWVIYSLPTLFAPLVRFAWYEH